MKRLWITIVLLIVMIAIDWLRPIAHHEGAPWQEWPGGYGLFGLIVCLILIAGAKALGALGILRNGDEP